MLDDASIPATHDGLLKTAGGDNYPRIETTNDLPPFEKEGQGGFRRLAQVGTPPQTPDALLLAPRSNKPMLPSSHKAAPASTAAWSSSDETPRFVGTLLHRLFERIALDHAHDEADVWNAARIQTLQPALRRELQHLGVLAGKLDAALAQVTHALHATLNDPRGRWILAKHEDAHCEWALSGLMDGTTINAVIDRSFMDNGIRWIIDYKTAAPNDASGESMNNFFDRQQEQYRAQLESYAALLRIQDSSTEIRLGLYFPLVTEWREWKAA
jgi:ATP-dependent exoDNAse (exonuclease V) beta subunit